MKKVLRIGYNRYYNDEVFEKHLEFVKNNLDVIDELTLFAEFSHYGYWDLETSQKNADIMKKRFKKYREIGVKRVGINILSTLGHIEEGWDVFPKAPLQYQINQEGVESKACLCPSNDDFLEYVKKRYAIYAGTGADFIWSDDDIRTSHHGVVKEFCYCPKCIKKFNDQYKTDFTREDLVEKIASDKDIKSKWDEFKTNVILRLYETIKEGIKEVDPKVEIGYMPCGAFASKTEWILGSGATMYRPGGGFYNDTQPIDVFKKSFNVQMENKNAPDYITDIQYEYEAFNYLWLERSVHITELETSLALMCGCNGILYNNDIFNDREDTTEMLRSSKNKWKTLTVVNKNCKNAGVYCNNIQVARLLNEISIPVTAFIENACAAVIIGDDWHKFEDNQIPEILAKNVLTDGRGLEILNERGFGAWCGGNVKAIHKSGMAERFGNHEFNGSYANYYRDVFMNFFYESDAYEIEPEENSEIISNLEAITHIPGGCSMYKYENTDGSKFVADGYLMLNSCQSPAKREQLGNTIDYLANGKLPVRIKKPIKVVPTVTTNDNGDMNIMLTNVSFDKTGSFECEIRNTSKFYIIDQEGNLSAANQTICGETSIISFDNIDAWNYVLLTNKQIY